MLLLLLACQIQPVDTPTAAPGEPAAVASPLDAMRSRPLDYTRHARCRMGCRDVTEAEVEGVLRDGAWIPDRTRTDGACPSHAVEGAGDDGQRLRIIFAECADETRVVTAIDLGREWPCACD